MSGVVLLCFATSAGAAGFSAPEYLSPTGGDAGTAQLAVDSQDRATIVWVRYDDPAETIGRIQSVRLGADGSPGIVQTLSDSGQGASVPQLAIDSQDRATIVWVRSDGTNDRVQSVRLDDDGDPGSVQTLSEAGADASAPQLATDSQGRVTVVWVRSDGSNDRVQSVRLDDDGDPGSVQTLSGVAGDASAPQLAVDSQDRATVVWSRSDGTNRLIQSVRLAADGAPGTVQTLSAAGRDAFTAGVAVDSQDRATVAWGRADETLADTFRVQVVRLDATGAPGSVHETPDSIHFAAPSTPRIAVDSQDRATIAWSANTGTHTQVVAWRFDADSNPGPEQYLSSGGDDSAAPELSFDSQDRATVVWWSHVTTPNGGGFLQIQSVRLDSEGSPDPRQYLTAPNSSAWIPQVATDSQDVVTVVSVQVGGLYHRIQFQRSGDTVAPDTQIDTGPAEGSTVTAPAVIFGFSGLPANYIDHFECRLDAGPVSTCDAAWLYPNSFNSLGDGPHTFEVAAVDLGGDTDPTPAVVHFTEAHAPPDTQILSGPPQGSTVTDPSLTISFSGSPAQWINFFQCKVDTGAFEFCSSPLTLGPLANGAHTFEVRAVDSGMYTDPTPATLNFTVADPPPAGTGQTAGEVAARPKAKCKKIRSHKRRRKCAKRAKSRRH